MALADAIRRFLSGTDTTLTPDRQRFVRDCADLGTDRCDRYRLYDDYYDGKQRVTLTGEARRWLEASGVPFCENVTELVIDTLADRLRVEGFQVPDQDEVSSWLTRDLYDGLDELQATVHTEVPKLGDGFVIVGWDPEQGRATAQWNHPRLIKPVYDDDGRLLYAVKRWASTQAGPANPSGADVWRLNIYLPDRTEKWVSGDREAEHWTPWLDEEGAVWPMPWTRSGELPTEGEADDPLGVNVVHFRHRPSGRWYGRSKVRGCIPYQDQLNKQVVDFFYVMNEQGWPQRWGTGVPEDARVSVGAGTILRSTSEGSRFGQFDAADPARMTEAIEATLRRLGTKTRTPLHDLGLGPQPSGESRKTAETGLVKEAFACHVPYGGAWTRVARLGWIVTDTYGDGAPPFDEAAAVKTVWDSPETRDEQAETTTVTLQVDGLGLSRTTALRKLGYDPDEEAKLREAEGELPGDGAPVPPVPPVPPPVDDNA